MAVIAVKRENIVIHPSKNKIFPKFRNTDYYIVPLFAI